VCGVDCREVVLSEVAGGDALKFACGSGRLAGDQPARSSGAL
jgi:hypothetical protein